MDTFWHRLPRPVVGLSAMDGVTDAAMREITAKYGHPDFMVTEFTSADGIIRGITRLLRDFYFTSNQRPIVAQIFGSNPEAFRKCAIICCFLGFDGIDLNMGCPAESVAHKGGGAALIKTPLLAQSLVLAAKQGVEEYVNGIELTALELPPHFVSAIEERSVKLLERKTLPVSVKTRIGYDKPVIETWIPQLLEVEPAVITIHGRTLEQQYGGQANWEEIAKAAQIIHQTETLIFGNGDLTTPEQIAMRIRESQVDGVWIGRAAMGNPWIFAQYHDFVNGRGYQEPRAATRFEVALEHAAIFEELNRTIFTSDPLPFLNMRKHLGWYIKGFPNASQLRAVLFQANSSEDVKKVLTAHSVVGLGL